MGGHLFSSNVRRDDESAALFDRSPISAGSSPSPLLLGNAAKKTMPTARRHVVVRFMCAPFAAVFRLKCARAGTNDDERSNDKAVVQRGDAARRPSLEELLRMEAASSSSSCPEHQSPQDMVSCCQKERAIVVLGITGNAHLSCKVEAEKEPLSVSKSHGAIATGHEQQTAIVPVKVDAGLKVASGGSATASPAVPISASLRRALLPAMRMDIGRTKGKYCKLAGSRATGKAELFYQRPISMGRRCRVQHLEESPYV